METEKRKVTVEELRELVRTAPEFKPFRDKMAELMVRVAKRRMARMKQEEGKGIGQ